MSRREVRQAEKAEKADRKKLGDMVRRICRECGHTWVIPRSLAKSARDAGKAAILTGGTGGLIAGAPLMAAMDTCIRCGSVRYFTEAPLSLG